MVDVGGTTRSVAVQDRSDRAIMALATTDVELVVELVGVGPRGPRGPSVTVYTQAEEPDRLEVQEGDFWVQYPPEVSPQPTFLWDGEVWQPIHGETVTFDDLTGVTIHNPATGDIIYFNGTEFVNTQGSTIYQPLDADLTSIAALPSAANKMLYATGARTWALTDLTVAARPLLSSETKGAMRTYLEVYSETQIGTPETDFVATFEAALR
jgi:hypothetical protein